MRNLESDLLPFPGEDRSLLLEASFDLHLPAELAIVEVLALFQDL